MKRKLVLFGIISALLVVFMSGCDNPTNPERGPTLTALKDEIDIAKDLKVGVQINPAASENLVALGIKYVSPSEMAALNTKILSAETVLGMSSPSQTMVDMATLNLVDAVSNFTIKTGSKDTFNGSDLSELINDATDRANEVLAGTQSTSAPGTEYVSSADKTALDTAIGNATSVLTNSPTDATAVNEAALALADAIQAFNEKTKTNGTKSGNYTTADLTALISAANTAKLGIATSSNGANVEPDAFWVASTDMNTFNAAIAAAENADNTNRDAQYVALKAAIATFNAAKKLGTKPTSKAVIITGLPSSANGSEIEAGIFVKAPSSPNDPYVAGGDATIQNGSATVNLSTATGPWTGTGSYYVGFYFGNTAYVSETTKPFVGATTTVSLADCKEMNLGGGPSDSLSKTVTITGLPAGARFVEVGIFAKTSDIESMNYSAGGEGAVQNRTATVYLYSETGPWTGTGNWYVGFFTDENKAYVTKTTKSFNGNSVNVAVADCTEVDYAPPGGDPSDSLSKTVTVTGFSGLNGSEIMLALFDTMPDFEDLDLDPSIYGEGLIENNRATVYLYSDKGPWGETGSYFIGFYAGGKGYFTTGKKTFSGNNVDVTVEECVSFDFAPPGGNGKTQAELNMLIADANVAKVGVQVSADGTDISIDALWVTPADMNMLNMAISIAESGGDINARYTALEAALFNFQKAMRPGTETEATDPGEGDPDKPDDPWKPGENEPGEGVLGTLNVVGLSGEFLAAVMTGTITPNNIADIMETEPVANAGTAKDSFAYLEWAPGYGTGTYNVMIASYANGGSIRFQNNVVFTNGSGSVNWGNMTTANVASLSVGTLSFTGGLPGPDWSILILDGPVTSETIWGIIDAFAYVAVAPGFPSGNDYMIMKLGATGGTFDKNGTYTIIYMDDEAFKYQNGVKFTNGYVRIDLSSLIDLDFGGGPYPIFPDPDEGGAGDSDYPASPPGTGGEGGGGTTLTPAQSLFRFAR